MFFRGELDVDEGTTHEKPRVELEAGEKRLEIPCGDWQYCIHQVLETTVVAGDENVDPIELEESKKESVEGRDWSGRHLQLVEDGGLEPLEVLM